MEFVRFLVIFASFSEICIHNKHTRRLQTFCAYFTNSGGNNVSVIRLNYPQFFLLTIISERYTISICLCGAAQVIQVFSELTK